MLLNVLPCTLILDKRSRELWQCSSFSRGKCQGGLDLLFKQLLKFYVLFISGWTGFWLLLCRFLKKHQWIGDLDNYSCNPANCFPPAVLQMSWRHLPHSSLLFSHFFHIFLLHRIFFTDLTWNLFLNTCTQNKYSHIPTENHIHVLLYLWVLIAN